ncbi:MAG: hypothetical protein GXN94_00260 [Aquificae bacterium]|nr:hypothetical protein [Aquificota bacterium]
MKTPEEVGLKISFEYLKGNDTLLQMVKQIADRHGIRGFLTKKEDKVEIIVSAPLEKLQGFSKELGELLPYSLFMSDASVETVEPISPFITEDFKIKTDLNLLPQNLSVCPSCLKELFDREGRRYHFPFISCNYCGSQYAYLHRYPFTRENTQFRFFNTCNDCKTEVENKNSFRHGYPLTACHNCFTHFYLKNKNAEKYGFDGEKTALLFGEGAGLLKEGKILKIYTQNGTKLIGLINEKNLSALRENLFEKRKPITVMFTGFDVLDRYLVLSELEKKVLASQEKPILYLKPSENFKERNAVSPFGFIKAKLPDTPPLLILSAYLKEKGVDFVFIGDFQENAVELIEFHIEADLPVVNLQEETTCIVIDSHIIIESGEKGILPSIVKSKKTGNLSIAGEYAALDLGDGEYLIDKKEKILNQLEDFVDSINSLSVLNGLEEEVKTPYKEKKKFYDFQGAVLSVLGEHNILEQPAAGIYLSKYSDHNIIGVKSHTRPFTPVIEVKPLRLYPDLKQTVHWIIKQIESHSEEGKRLIANFSRKYPDLYGRIGNSLLTENYKLSSNITAVFNAVSFLLETFPYEDADYFEEPFLFLSKEAVNFQGKKGVRIDYLLVEEGGRFLLDWRKLIQSVLSYKLAGAEKDMVAFSVLEGFGDWIINQTLTICSKLKIENVALAGDLLTEPITAGKLINALGKEKNLYLNRKLPVDRQNVAFGGIFV